MEDIEQSVPLLVSSAWLALMTGDIAGVTRWQLLAEIKAAVCPVTAVVESAEIDVALSWLRLWRDPPITGHLPAMSVAALTGALPADDRWQPAAGFLAGMLLTRDGDTGKAVSTLRAAAELSAALNQPLVQADCLAALAMLSFDDGDPDESPGLATASELLMTGYQPRSDPTSVFAESMVGLALARTGDYSAAAVILRRVRELLTALPDLTPWLFIQLAVVQAKTYLLLGDAGAARQLVRRARYVQVHHDGAASAPARWLSDMESLLAQLPAVLAYEYPPLTAAELRVLRLLPTYLTFPEMGELLFLSRYTVKSHAMSIYRKLGAASRQQVVERASSLGFLPVSAVPRCPLD